MFSSYQNNIFANRQNAKRRLSSPERSKLCRFPFIPPYLYEKLDKKAKQQLRRPRQDTSVLPDHKIARIFFENGVEARLTPSRDGLAIDVIYHFHPWVRGNHTRSDHPLFSISVPWHDIVDHRWSSHQVINFIMNHPKEAPDINDSIHISGAGRNSLHFYIDHILVLVSRDEYRGLYIIIGDHRHNFAMTPPTSPEITGSVIDISEKITDAARVADKAYSKLPIWRQAALKVATDLHCVIQNAF